MVPQELFLVRGLTQCSLSGDKSLERSVDSVRVGPNVFAFDLLMGEQLLKQLLGRSPLTKNLGDFFQKRIWIRLSVLWETTNLTSDSGSNTAEDDVQSSSGGVARQEVPRSVHLPRPVLQFAGLTVEGRDDAAVLNMVDHCRLCWCPDDLLPDVAAT